MGITMSKTDLVGAVAAKTETSKKDAEKAVNATLEAITQALANGDKVQLIGFGTFEVKERAERIGRNPQTKQEIIIPASKLPSFKAGKALKDAVSK
jgi:DNA-binding protein HU-beta